MKKLILLLLLIPSLCLAGTIKVEDGGGNIAYDYMAPEAETPETTDMTRGFEVAIPAGWTSHAGGLIAEESTTQFKDTAQSMALTLTNGTDDFQYYDMTEGKAAFSASFWFRTPGVNGTTTSNMTIFTASTGTASMGGTLGMRVYLNHYSTNLVRIVARGTDFGAYVVVDANAWVRIEIDFVQNAATQVDVYNTVGELIGSADITALDNAPRYLLFGSDGSNSVGLDTQLVYFDGIGLDFTDSTYPLYPFTVGN